MTSSIQKILKRDKSVVDFTPDKINLAIQKAFIEVRNGFDATKVEEITMLVLEELERLFVDTTPMVEHVQDIVERELMQQGYFDVAKSYILYRYEHTKQREEKKKETLEKIELNTLMVTKRSGKKEPFAFEKIKKSLNFAVVGFEDVVDAEVILNQCRSELYEGIKTSDIARSLIMTTRAMIEQDPVYSHVAARLLLFMNYKQALGADIIDYSRFDEQYRAAFIRNIKRGVELERLDPKLLTFDLEKLSKALVIDRDDLFVYLGLQTLYDRYFLADHTSKQVLETPQMFWMRIAMGAAIQEGEYKHEWTIKFYISCLNCCIRRLPQPYFMLEPINHNSVHAI
jgi:ribonucleoside-diphosphate reductase alpha chain